jgi:probable F420-dependent oxidoreductase
VGSIGVAVKSTYGELPRLARDVERRGFDTIWLSETRQDSIIQATLAVTATQRIRVGTSITLAFPRSPTVTAMQAWDLDELSGGRFVMGLGSQVRRIIEERYSSVFDRPAERMAEYLQAMRTVWAMERGDRTPFDGEIFRVLRPGLSGLGNADRPPPAVYLAAVGPLMTRTAARHADGTIGHPFTSPRFIENSVLPRLEEELSAAGRDRESFVVVQGTIVSIADRREDAIWDAKRQIGFYGTTPNYRAVFASYGDENLTETLRQVFRETGGDADALAAAIPDELVDRYALAGTAEEVRDRLPVFAELVDHLQLGSPWYGIPAGRIRENLDAIITTCGRSGPEVAAEVSSAG